MGRPQSKGSRVNPAGAIGTLVVGYGYWGPNIVRNVVESPDFRMMGLCEQFHYSRRLLADRAKDPVDAAKRYKAFLYDFVFNGRNVRIVVGR